MHKCPELPCSTGEDEAGLDRKTAEHLLACSPCRAKFLRHLRPGPELPAGLDNAVRAHRDKGPAFRRRRLFRLSATWAGAAAACFLLCLGLWLRQPPPVFPLNEADYLGSELLRRISDIDMEINRTCKLLAGEDSMEIGIL